jgi:peroxiredoxin
LTRPIAQLIQSGAAEQALSEGASAPDFTPPDAFGNPVTLSHLFQQGPVVITFYRGAWCPYCRLTLHAYQQALPQIQEAGASLVAISPQTPEHSRALVEKEELTFAMLSDAGNTVARRFGLVYTLDEAVRAAHQQVGADLPAFNGDDSWELPMPGTFIVDQAGTVLLAFVDPDFTHRLDPSAIIGRLLARLATLAIEKTQLLTRTHQVAAREERQRIARDLHDSVTQTLFGLQAVAQAALDFWETQPAQARAAVETILHLARGASVEMRTLLFGLRDEALQHAGLAGALEMHVAMAALSAFIALLGLGVLRRWRWTFWLLVVAFLFGELRVPASVLALTGVLPTSGPTWYVLVQALIGLLQCAIGLAMLGGYRRAGVWGAF